MVDAVDNVCESSAGIKAKFFVSILLLFETSCPYVVRICFTYDFCSSFCFQNNWTALLKAADKGHTEIVNLLLNNGADVNHGDNVRKNRYFLVVLSAYLFILFVLFQQYDTFTFCYTEQSVSILIFIVHPLQNDFAALLLAAKAGKADTVHALLAHPAVLVNRVDKVLICTILKHLRRSRHFSCFHTLS